MTQTEDTTTVPDTTSAVSDSTGTLVFVKDPSCTECGLNRSDPTPNELMMYLHALRYSGDGWEYKTEPPLWADMNWTFKE